MDTLLLIYANSYDEPLPSLHKEYKEVSHALSSRVACNDIKVIDNYATSITDFQKKISIHKDEISIFMYSGHANEKNIILEDGIASGDGLASFLNECPKLKLIILNGCSTHGHLKRLQSLDKPIIIISTSRAIKDGAATNFSINFFSALARGETIISSYNLGISGAKLVTDNNHIIESRGLIISQSFENSNKPLWGIFHTKKGEALLKYKLSKNESLLSETTEQIDTAPILSEINRSEQEASFTKILRKKNSVNALVAYGDRKHDHSLLKKRLQEIIRNTPSINKMQTYFNYDIPKKGKSPVDFNIQIFRKSRQRYNLNEIVKKYKNQVLFFLTSLEYEDIRANPYIVDWYFDYWNKIEKPSNNTILISLLSLEHEAIPIGKFQKKIYSLFNKRSIEDHVADILNQASNTEQKLPELNHIKLKDLFDWYDEHEKEITNVFSFDCKASFENKIKTCLSSDKGIYLSYIRKKLEQ